MILLKIHTDTQIPKQILEKINKANSSVDEIIHTLKELHKALDEDWDDPFRKDFDESFKKHIQLLYSFIDKDNPNNASSKLIRIIEALDEYENITFEV